MRVKCLAQKHNTMSPARARTRTARSGDERTNHEATATMSLSTIVDSMDPPMAVAVVRTRPRVIPLAIITMRKSTSGFLFLSYISMGLHLEALRAAGASLQRDIKVSKLSFDSCVGVICSFFFVNFTFVIVRPSYFRLFQYIYVICRLGGPYGEEL